MNRKLWVLCPCYFDVPSFLKLRKGILKSLEGRWEKSQIQMILIDDTAGVDPAITELLKDSEIRVISPPYNLGHQGALVYALRSLSAEVDPSDYIVTMDSDGEDRPEDLNLLLSPLQDEGSGLHQICIASRTKRKESLLFKLFYLGFKFGFWLLTGTLIRNGNFAAFRGWLLKEVIYHPHFDQCYSSSFVSLPLRICRVPLPRGDRYEGRSKMGILGLFTHGIRMMMPFSEKIAIRGMVFSIAVILTGFGVGVARIFREGDLLLPLLVLLMGFVLAYFSVILFSTFSQSKARSLRGLQDFPKMGSPRF